MRIYLSRISGFGLRKVLKITSLIYSGMRVLAVSTINVEFVT